MVVVTAPYWRKRIVTPGPSEVGSNLILEQKLDERRLVEHFQQRFDTQLQGLVALVQTVPQDALYRRSSQLSVGEQVLRSAAVIEQLAGGLTTNLWDDPFEWALPETLSDTAKVVEYLAEVTKTQELMFGSLNDDSLLQTVLSPNGTETILNLLIDTLIRSADYRGRAIATLKMLA